MSAKSISALATLLDEFARGTRERDRARTQRMKSTLTEVGFGVRALREARTESLRSSMAAVLGEMDGAMSRRQQEHAGSSPNLNCWDVLRLTDDEVSHCMVLAWLLDRGQSHAQGSLVFDTLLKGIAEIVPLPRDCSQQQYKVATEVRHSRSRIDIEIIGETFLLHIESKVQAAEGEEQTCREREDLKAKASARQIKQERAWGLYLTVDGSPCLDTEKFRPLSWMAVVAVIEEANGIIRDRHPRNLHLPWVLESYAEVVRRHVLRLRAG